MSWDLPGPLPTTPPTVSGPSETSDPEYPEPVPTPSNQISLYPSSYSVSWDTGAAPAPTEEPEPGLPGPVPSNQISLNPPSYSVSWDLPPTKAPWTPNPTRQPGHHTHRPSSAKPPYSVTWETGSPANTGGVSWDVPQGTTTSVDDEPTPPPANQPSDQISLYPPSASVTWNKRGEASLTSSWGFQFTSIIPSASKPSKYTGEVSWYKRQDEADPTSDPGDDLPPPFTPTPSNDIGIQPPSATISWGKREPAQSNSFGLGKPTHSIWWPRPPKTSAYISWGKRQEDEPTDDPTDALPPPAQQTPPDEISVLPPSATVIWGRDAARPTKKPTSTKKLTSTKKPSPTPSKPSSSLVPSPPSDPDPTDDPQPTDDPDPTDEVPPPPQQTPPDQISIQPPSATVIWGRDAARPTKKHTSTKKKSSTPSPSSALSAPSTPSAPSDPEPTDDPQPTDDPTDEIPPPPQQTPSNEIGLQPPSATVIWGRDAAKPTKKTTKKPASSTPAPTQSDSAGLQFPTYSVIWPKPSVSSAYVSWGKREPAPQSNDIGFQPPTASISWGKRDAAAEPTAAPVTNEDRDAEADPQWLSWGQPRPSPPSWISWGRDASPAPTAIPAVEDKREAEAEPQWLSWGQPKPSPPSWISWGRDAAPEPTAAPALEDKRHAEAEPQWLSWDPQNPQLPPWWPRPSSPNYVSWDKKNAAPEPTADAAEVQPEWVSWYKRDAASEPTAGAAEVQPEWVSWYKRDAAPEPTAAAVLDEKRDAEPEAQWISWDPQNPPYPPWWPRPSPSSAFVSWGKRDAAPEPTAAAVLAERDDAQNHCASTTTVTRVRPCPLAICDIACPVGLPKPGYDIVGPDPNALPACPVTVTAIRKCPTCNCGLPTPVPVSLKAREENVVPQPSLHYRPWPPAGVDAREENIIPTPPPYSVAPPPSISLSIIPPTTFSRHTYPGHTPSPSPSYTHPHPSSACPDVTKTIVPPCIPPSCPLATETPCDFNKAVPKMEKVRREPVVEKTIVTIKTKSVGKPTPVAPTWKPSTVVGGCTTARTLTVNLGCPTYTCVPGGLCDPYQVVR